LTSKSKKSEALLLPLILIILIGSIFLQPYPYSIKSDFQGSLFLSAFGTTERSVTDGEGEDNSTSSSTPPQEEASDSDSESEDNSTSSSTPTEDRIPVADAGPDVTVQSQTLTQLDGSNSNGPNTSGDDVSPSLNYDWKQTAGPEVALNNPNTANPDFISPQTREETQLTFQLIVSTDSATSDPDSVTVSVTPSVIPQTPETPTAAALPSLSSSSTCATTS